MADAEFQKTYTTPAAPGHKDAVALIESLYRRVNSPVTG
jgi:hypothetical protein